ncbi:MULTISPECIES: hypothetical protein [Peribacillus]|uniref:hypothetical protein n=1 Tax=Peribacillus TaxID=2675229 RepID=UPI0034DB462D
MFDAVTSNRVYRKAMLPHQGLEVLYAGVGKSSTIRSSRLSAGRLPFIPMVYPSN